MRKTIWMLVLAAVCGGANAEMYRWVDSDGNVTYMDQEPPAAVKESSMLKLPFLGGSSRSSLNPVVLYYVPGCSSCDSARDYMKLKGVPYTEKNVESDIETQRELRERAGTLTVPTLVVGETIMKGYTEGWLDKELRLAGYFGEVKVKKPVKPKVQEEALLPPPEE